jgi:hypothetical protein
VCQTPDGRVTLNIYLNGTFSHHINAEQWRA